MITKAALKAIVAGLALIAAGAAQASPECTKEPKDKWLSEADMKAKVAEAGYTFKVLKVEGSCYEIYGHNKDGKQVEVYFDPVTAAAVEEEIEK
jgi:hypothetical protein